MDKMIWKKEKKKKILFSNEKKIKLKQNYGKARWWWCQLGRSGKTHIVQKQHIKATKFVND